MVNKIFNHILFLAILSGGGIVGTGNTGEQVVSSRQSGQEEGESGPVENGSSRSKQIIAFVDFEKNEIEIDPEIDYLVSLLCVDHGFKWQRLSFSIVVPDTDLGKDVARLIEEMLSYKHIGFKNAFYGRINRQDELDKIIRVLKDVLKDLKEAEDLRVKVIEKLKKESGITDENDPKVKKFIDKFHERLREFNLFFGKKNYLSGLGSKIMRATILTKLASDEELKKLLA